MEPAQIPDMVLDIVSEVDGPALLELYRSIGMIGRNADGSETTDLRPWIRSLNGTLVGRKLVVDGILVGGGQLTRQKQMHVYELGYWIGSTHQSKGYGTIVARLFAELAFTQLSCHRLFAKTSSRNRASIRVLEKSGFKLEGTLRDVFQSDGVFYDEVYYGCLASEWRAGQASAGAP